MQDGKLTSPSYAGTCYMITKFKRLSKNARFVLIDAENQLDRGHASDSRHISFP